MSIDWGGTGVPNYPGKSVSDLLTDSLDRLRQPPGNYTRFSQSNILSALNDAQLEVAKRKQCIRSFAIIQMAAMVPQYAPPSQMLIPTYGKFVQSASSYQDLTFKTRRWMDKYNPGWRTSRGQPWVMVPGDSYGGLRKLQFYPYPEKSGNSFTVAGTGVVTSGTGLATSGNIIGVNGVANSTTCTDSQGQLFADLGVQVGMVALNTKDGSQGQISAVSGSTFTCVLSGGTSNVWGVNNTYVILAGEYGIVTGLTFGQESYIFGSEVGEIDTLSPSIGNVYLEFSRRPIPLKFMLQYPEIPIETQQYLPEYVLWKLKRGSPKGSGDFQEAATALQIFDREFPPMPATDIEDAMETKTVAMSW